MPRLTVSARDDLDKPIVEVDPNAPRWKRALVWALRSYLVLAAVITVLAGIGLIVVLVSL